LQGDWSSDVCSSDLEMGNAMGFAEDQGQDVAGMTLQAGERRVPVGSAQASAETRPGPKVTGPSSTEPGATTASNGPASVTQTIRSEERRVGTDAEAT